MRYLKKAAVTAAKIKDGAVTGAKIDLSTLGTVPSATTAGTAGHASSADTAGSADTAKSAGHAGTADSATSANHADTADSAADADELGGLPPEGFMHSDRFTFGTASTDPSTPQEVLTIGGIDVTTSGTNPTTFEVRIVNHNPHTWEFSTAGGIWEIGEGERGLIESPSARSMVIVGRDREDTAKAILLECGSDESPDILDCFAQLSPEA